MCAVRASGGWGVWGVFDRSPPRTETRTPQGRLCFYTSATSLRLRLSPSGYGFPLPYLVVFPPLALPLLLSGGHPCPRHLFRSTPHTETGGRRVKGDGAKVRISEEGIRERCTVRASVDICRLSGVMYECCFHRDITERHLCLSVERGCPVHYIHFGHFAVNSREINGTV